MTKLARCDNKECERDVTEGATYYELTPEIPYPTIADDLNAKQFCCLLCVATYCAKACGKEVR